MICQLGELPESTVPRDEAVFGEAGERELEAVAIKYACVRELSCRVRLLL